VRRSGSIADYWASSEDLLDALRSRRGRRIALEAAIRNAIHSGQLQSLDPLPSSRSLARELGLARGTVTEAYAQLTAEGYLAARPGAPTRVAASASAAERGRPEELSTRPRLPLSLELGVPDVAAFPRAAWSAAVRRALTAAPDALLTLGDPRGSSALREALASHLRRTRGVIAEPDRIVITCGFSHGLALLCRALRAHGLDRLAIEDPCLHQQRAIAAGAGLQVVPMAVDDQGATAAPPDGARVVLVTPAHQFPLGMTLAPSRRRALVAWAKARDALVIEDDYDGEYRYDHQPVGALQGLDPEHVIYAGTASKTLAPALRLGWLVLPDQLVEPTLAAKQLLGGEPGVTEQLAMAEILQSGAYDRHVRRMRHRYRRRHDQLLELLGERFPTLTPSGIAAGLHVVINLPPGLNEQEIVKRAVASGLHLDALGPFWHDPTGRPGGLALGYAAPPDHAWGRTLAALVTVLDQHFSNAGRISRRADRSGRRN
jgi:GntR family transcriptional regulator/MocR family aminotransferase